MQQAEAGSFSNIFLCFTSCHTLVGNVSFYKIFQTKIISQISFSVNKLLQFLPVTYKVTEKWK